MSGDSPNVIGSPIGCSPNGDGPNVNSLLGCSPAMDGEAFFHGAGRGGARDGNTLCIPANRNHMLQQRKF